MRDTEDIRFFLLRGGSPHHIIEADSPMWSVSNEPADNIVVTIAEDLVIFRCKVLTVNENADRQELYEKLLRYNAAEMIHGAYGLEGNDILLTCVLRLENLDYNEFQGTIDDFSVALTKHLPGLAAYAAPSDQEEGKN